MYDCKNVSMFVNGWKWNKRGISVQHFITVLSCELTVSVKENPDKKKQKIT